MQALSDKRCAFLFQGVGDEYQEFSHLLDEKQKESLNSYCSRANKEIGLDLWNYLFHSAATKHDKMFNDWIAIYTCDCIAYNTYIELGIRPELLLGYSMGLITEMTCAKSISYETGLQMLLTIYEYPKLAARKGEGMGAIVGKTYRQVDEIIHKNNLQSHVMIASENNGECIVISGLKSGISQVLKVAENEGAIKVMEINSPYAFHSPFAANGIERFADLMEKLQVLDSTTPIMSAFNQDILQHTLELKKELVKNMTSPMQWKDGILKLSDLGIDTFIEVSLGDSITKMSRIISIDNDFLTYKKISRLKTSQC
ncbi:ACP S-malonyltransferase [Ruminiclostridium cellobioparum]|uniref:[acyl-carrier-protein] S-malonyltransferase n=1 Tax=Ruminiclostridium cellobioparum subsp. termitidis CT1112 TaxID=1195236 RepID=S0FQU4_RUMCE|nr:ACP S-malonyltransferase [Ruminiclostridium cellobioparum]EMS72741.1 (acyl-carrier-protein) S-malonyltransferase [Ruminiclostridium cellobioparum subsp. termitidis CT1112]